MSRHRIVRTMDYKDEYDSYDDVYGHSVDDDNCISPTDASQWIYDRAKGQQSISAFMANNRNIEEEDEDECSENDGCTSDADKSNKKRRDSENFQMPVLDDIEQAKLISCIDEIRSVVGDMTSERQIVETAMKYAYDVSKTLDEILNATSTPPQQIDTASTSIKGATLERDFIKDTNKSTQKFNPNMSKLNDFIQNLKISSTSDNAGVSKFDLTLPKSNKINPENFDMNKSSSKLSNFINKKKLNIPKTTGLGENPSKLRTDFVLPNLKLNTKSSLVLPVILPRQITKSEDPIKETTKPIKLSLRKSPSPPPINLMNAIGPKNNENTISSDRLCLQLKDSLQLNLLCNTYQDISDLCKKPSAVGRILNLRYKCKDIPYVKHTNVTHSNLFNFETKSPDDITTLSQN